MNNFTKEGLISYLVHKLTEYTTTKPNKVYNTLFKLSLEDLQLLQGVIDKRLNVTLG